MKPTFKNKENEHVKLQDGRDAWLSRANAVVAHVCVYSTEKRKWYLLIGKRGSTTPDFRGYWGLPCGYLDWNETLCEAVVRETWEECGLLLTSLRDDERFIESNSAIINNPQNISEKPWLISDEPLGDKQNLSFHFPILFSWDGELPALTFENAEEGEVSDLSWMPFESINDMVLAFNHNQRFYEMKKSLDQDFKKITLIS